MKFKAFYNPERFRYIHGKLNEDFDLSFQSGELIPKTACFISENIDVYIDTSDGVNDDLKMQEYCGRIFACSRLSSGKKFLFFKSAYSSKYSKNIEKVAAQNNGTVFPFFKWSFNKDFYDYMIPNLETLRKKNISTTNRNTGIGFFADPSKVYSYPKQSNLHPMISCTDINKFSLNDILGEETAKIEVFKNSSRIKTLEKLKSTKFSVFHGPMPYKQYIEKSIDCQIVFNPPGIGEYTSRMMDQTALGNLIVLRKNSYDQGYSWKNYIPEVDLDKDGWQEDLYEIVENRSEWSNRCLEYYRRFWTPNSIVGYFKSEIEKNA